MPHSVFLNLNRDSYPAFSQQFVIIHKFVPIKFRPGVTHTHTHTTSRTWCQKQQKSEKTCPATLFWCHNVCACNRPAQQWRTAAPADKQEQIEQLHLQILSISPEQTDLMFVLRPITDWSKISMRALEQSRKHSSERFRNFCRKIKCCQRWTPGENDTNDF